MTRVGMKMLVAGVVLAGAAAFLAVAGMKEGWVYYLPVDSFAEDAAYHSRRVRLHGRVGEENLEVRPAGLLAEFDLHGEVHLVRVAYEGTVPDTFQADREVVVEGTLDDTGVFRADTLLTKCASKYEAGAGEAPHADPLADETAETDGPAESAGTDA